MEQKCHCTKNALSVVYIENTDPFNNFVGGIPTYIRNAALNMKKKGLKVCFIGTILSEKEGIRNIFETITSLSNVKIGHFGFLIKMFKNFRNLSIDQHSLIHCQRLMLCLPFIFSFKSYSLICTSHGIERLQIKGRKGWLQGLIYGMVERIVVPRLKLLLVVDPHTERYFKKRFALMHNRIIRIPIGIERERFYPIENGDVRNSYGLDRSCRNLLFVGRIEYPKNLELIFKAIQIVRKKGINLRLIIGGEGRDKIRYIEYCKKEKLDIVEFLGGVPPQELVNLLNICDVLLLSSLSEGSPTVVKEAISCNLPVVSTNVGDVEEVIKGLEGCHVVDFDPHAYANCIVKSLSVKKVNFQHRVELYSNEILFSKLYQQYQKVFSENQR